MAKMGKPNRAWNSAARLDRIKKRTEEGVVARRIKKLKKARQFPIKLMIYNNLCPGDCLIMTAALRCLHKQYPGKFITDVRSFCEPIFQNNPFLTHLDDHDPEVVHLWTTYPLVNKTTQRPVHFMEGYTDWFEQQLGLRLYLDSGKREITRPFIYLTKEEMKAKPQIPGKYWVINAGYKTDYTIKKWKFSYYQDVVDYFHGKIQFVQIGTQGKKNQIHQPLERVINLIGKTDLRQLMLICYNAQGGLGPVTCIQHMFASYMKPYVVLHGAREPIFWTAYHTQKVFSNIGTLPCCKEHACWRSRVVDLGDGDKKNKRLCELPVTEDNDPTAQCMYNIKPEQVVTAIEDWYKGGVLSY